MAYNRGGYNPDALPKCASLVRHSMPICDLLTSASTDSLSQNALIDSTPILMPPQPTHHAPTTDMQRSLLLLRLLKCKAFVTMPAPGIPHLLNKDLKAQQQRVRRPGRSTTGGMIDEAMAVALALVLSLGTTLTKTQDMAATTGDTEMIATVIHLHLRTGAAALARLEVRVLHETQMTVTRCGPCFGPWIETRQASYPRVS